MAGDGPPDDEGYLTERVREELSERPDVEEFDLCPAEMDGVVATVQSDAGTEHYHVTLETLPDGERNLHWTSLGEEFDP